MTRSERLLFYAFGWGWIALGVLGLVCMFRCVHMFWGVLGSLDFYVVALIGVITGLFTVVAGVYFIRRRPWARLGLELTCWFLVLVSVATMWLLYLMRQKLQSYGYPETDQLARLLHPTDLATW